MKAFVYQGRERRRSKPADAGNCRADGPISGSSNDDLWNGSAHPQRRCTQLHSQDESSGMKASASWRVSVRQLPFSTRRSRARVLHLFVREM